MAPGVYNSMSYYCANYFFYKQCLIDLVKAVVQIRSAPKFYQRKILFNMSSIDGIRAKYNDRSNLLLEENLVSKDPLQIFQVWLEKAMNTSEIIEPNAMCLATATKDAVPSARFVLCKGYGKDGFKFFTHYTSRKGQELEENPNAALTFYWPPLNRSVRIEGHVEKLPMSQAEEYFSSRPYSSQIGALASDQSKPIPGRHGLLKEEIKLKDKYGPGQVPRPPLWGGYIVIPNSIEFWQGQSDRIHDRIKFRKPQKNEAPDDVLTHQGEDGWIYERLAP